MNFYTAEIVTYTRLTSNKNRPRCEYNRMEYPYLTLACDSVLEHPRRTIPLCASQELARRDYRNQSTGLHGNHVLIHVVVMPSKIALLHVACDISSAEIRAVHRAKDAGPSECRTQKRGAARTNEQMYVHARVRTHICMSLPA